MDLFHFLMLPVIAKSGNVQCASARMLVAFGSLTFLLLFSFFAAHNGDSVNIGEISK